MGPYDLVKVSTATTGMGTITLGAAVDGGRTFAAAGVPNGSTLSYGIEEGTSKEAGIGVYDSGAGTLTRSLVASSTGALLNLTGTAKVYITALARDWLLPVRNIASGRFFIVDTMTTNATNTMGPATNTLYGMPFSRRLRIDALVCEVTAAGGAGHTARLALYSCDEHGLPGALIEEGAPVATDSLGVKIATLSAARWIDRPVWIAFSSSGTAPTMRTGALQAGLQQTLGHTTLSAGAVYAIGVTRTQTFGTMPSAFGGALTAVTSQNQMPMLAVRSA